MVALCARPSSASLAKDTHEVLNWPHYRCLLDLFVLKKLPGLELGDEKMCAKAFKELEQAFKEYEEAD